MVNDLAVQEFVKAIKDDPQDTNTTYSAIVSHVDDEGVVWVNLQGSDKETPTASTSSEVKAGDSVTVQWRNNKLYIEGNYSNPSAGFNTVAPSVNYVAQLVDKDITVKSITAATGYIEDLTSKNITAEDITADHATIKDLDVESIDATVAYIEDLTAEHITAEDIVADHETVDSLDANYAKINAANVTDLSAQNAWVNKIMVQTGLIAHESDIFTLDAIQVNAANITAGTIDVNRLIVTVDGEKYLVEIDPTTHQPSYEKLDGGIVEPRTITADKIVAHDITVQEITTENLAGTNGWINLNQGTFFFTTNGTTWANTTNGIMWDGTNLKIKGDVNITAGNVYTKTEADAKYATQASLAITNDAITSEVKAREASDNLLLDSDAPNLGAVYASANRYISDASSTSEYVTANNVELTDPPEQGIKYARRFVCNGTNTTSVGRAYAFYNTSENIIPYVPNTTYTATWWARCTNGQGQTNCHYPKFDGTTSNSSSERITLTSEWQKITAVFTTGSTPNTNYNRLWFYARFPANTSGTIDICGCKLVAGDAVEAYSTKIEQTANNVLIQATASDTTAAQGGQHLIQSLINVAPSGVTIDASKVNITGVITAINNDTTTTIDGDKITTGTLSASAVDATSGTFNTANIPNLSAAKITSGTIDIGRVPAAALNSNVLVGGRNLLLNTARPRVSPSSATASSNYPSPTPILSGYGDSIMNNTTDEWTYSFDYNVTGNSSTTSDIYVQIRDTMASGSSLVVSGNKSGHYSKTFKLSSEQAGATSQQCRIRLRNATEGAVLTASNIKLEKGNKETDWSPAPEDAINSNLLVGSQRMDSWYVGADASKVTTGEYGVATLNGNASAYTARLDGRPSIKTSLAINGTPLWLSFDYTASVDTSVVFRFCGSDQKDGSPTLGNLTKYYQKTISLTAASSYTRYRVNIPVLSTADMNVIVDDSISTNSVFVRFYNRTNNSVLKIRRMKLEHGIAATGWCPSEEEVQAYVTRIDQDGIRIHPSTTQNNSVVINSDGMEVFVGGIESSNSVAMYGAEARIGKSSTRHVEIKDGGMQVLSDSSTELANLGFGNGKSISGTIKAPYYTLGKRKSGSIIGNYSVAEGYDTTASHVEAHAEGYSTTASGVYAHAEGREAVASGDNSHAEGGVTTASGERAHAEGSRTTASGYASHAEGYYTVASGSEAHAGGYYTIAKGGSQVAIGNYNVADTTSLLIIGNGTADDARSNAFVVKKTGQVLVNGTSVHSSDRRLKEHISYLGDEAIDFINGLKPAHYNKDGEPHVGFYAQDVEEVDKWDCMTGEMNGYMTLGYMELLAPIVAYIQNLEKRIEELERSK